jgi:hypothetical protein
MWLSCFCFVLALFLHCCLPCACFVFALYLHSFCTIDSLRLPCFCLGPKPGAEAGAWVGAGAGAGAGPCKQQQASKHASKRQQAANKHQAAISNHEAESSKHYVHQVRSRRQDAASRK